MIARPFNYIFFLRITSNQQLVRKKHAEVFDEATVRVDNSGKCGSTREGRNESLELAGGWLTENSS